MRYILIGLLFSVFCGKSIAQEYITVEDLSGRIVKVKKNPKRIILTSARQIYWLSMVRENPFENVVGLDGSWWKYDNHFYNVLTNKYPNSKTIQNLGNGQNTDFNAEYFIALNPDVVFMSSYNASSFKVKAIIDKLEKFGIPVITVSSQNHLYLSNLQSLRIMGKIFNREKHVSKLEDFILHHLNIVFKRLGQVKTMTRPKVVMELSPGYSNVCCTIVGKESFGIIIEDAGGENWGGRILPNGGTMNIEQAYVTEFDKVLVSGGAWTLAKPEKTNKFLELGYQAKIENLRKSFDYLSNRHHWKNLQAVENNEIYGIWHQYATTPYSFLATITMAKWFYPDKFQDIDIKKIEQDFHQLFMPFKMQGYLAISKEETK